jgi:hypothetical protein
MQLDRRCNKSGQREESYSREVVSQACTQVRFVGQGVRSRRRGMEPRGWGVELGTSISPLHRHRLFWRGDRRLQLQRAEGVRGRRLRHAGTGSASSEPPPLLDAPWSKGRCPSQATQLALLHRCRRAYLRNSIPGRISQCRIE